nr:MAG TPA: tify domain [Caudoviricetes sp.]
MLVIKKSLLMIVAQGSNQVCIFYNGAMRGSRLSWQ